jgi:hypothetical protein
MTEYHDSSVAYEVARELVKYAGPTLEPEELEGAVATLSAKYEKELDDVIRGHEEFAAAGVENYRDYREFQTHMTYYYVEQDAPRAIEDYLAALGTEEEYHIAEDDEEFPYDPEADYTPTEAQKVLNEKGYGLMDGANSRLDMIEHNIPVSYERFAESFYYEMMPAQRAFIEDQIESGKMNAIHPLWAFWGYNGEVLLGMMILILALVTFLLAPVLTRENMSRVSTLQYASRAGRGVLRTQTFAMLSVAAVISLLVIGVTYAVYIHGGWGTFLGANVNGFADGWSVIWFDGTVGALLALCAAMIFGTSVLYAALLCFISKHAKTYIILILATVPLLAAGIQLAYTIYYGVPLTMTFPSVTTGLHHIYTMQYLDIYVIALLALIAAVMVTVMLRRHRRADL